MEDVRVTVYIPSYNNMKYLRDAIESALFQEYENMEILISDDGSTDGSVEYLKKCAVVQKEWIRVFFHDKPHGSCGDINGTLAHATGSIIVKLDSDDILFENFWRNFLPFFSSPKVGVVSAPLIAISETGSILSGPQLPDRAMNPIDVFDHNILFSGSPFRIEMFKQVGGWDSGRPHPDWDFWIRCILAGWKIAYCTRPGYYYRQHKESILHTLDKQTKEDTHAYYRNKYKAEMDKLGLEPAPPFSGKIGVPKKGDLAYKLAELVDTNEKKNYKVI